MGPNMLHVQHSRYLEDVCVVLIRRIQCCGHHLDMFRKAADPKRLDEAHPPKASDVRHTADFRSKKDDDEHSVLQLVAFQSCT